MTRKVDIIESDFIMIGDTRILQFNVKNTNVLTLPVPVQDITGYTWSFEVRERIDDAAAIITKTTAGGGIVNTTPLSGIVQVTISAADWTLITEATQAHYSMKRTDPGMEHTVAFGEALIQKAAQS